MRNYFRGSPGCYEQGTDPSRGVGDGGYLVPDDFEGCRYCFSPGVSTSASFEEDLAHRGIRSFLTDFSVDRPPIESEKFVFDKKYLGAIADKSHFTLTSWIDKYLPQSEMDLVLQMDIEGAEYEVLCELPPTTLRRFRTVVVKEDVA